MNEQRADDYMPLSDGRMMLLNDSDKYQRSDLTELADGSFSSTNKTDPAKHYMLIKDKSKISLNETSSGKHIRFGHTNNQSLSDTDEIYNDKDDKKLLIVSKKYNETLVIFEPSQVDAVYKIADFFSKGLNPICGHPPGEGKTYIACELIRRFRLNEMGNILVIAKSGNINDPWEKELKHFNIPFRKTYGKNRHDDYLVGDKYETGGRILLTSYDTGLLDMKYLTHTEYDLVVFDEMHSIINPKKLTQKSLGFAGLKAKHRLALTATPIKNYLEDIGLLYLFLNRPEFFLGLSPGENIQKNIEIANAVAEAKKSEIIILPENISNRGFAVNKALLSVPVYQEMIDFQETNEEISKLLMASDVKYLSFLSHPDSLYYFNSSEKTNIPCAKVDAVKMIVENAGKDEKIIIFSRFIDVLNNFYTMLDKEGYHSIIITGKDRGNEHKRKLSQFKDNDSFRILLTTIFKSVEGLNFESANHVIILEFWWNPQILIQAMGRIDRRTQKRDIFIYLLCYNKNGELYKPELNYYEVMKEKINKSRSVNRLQQDLPEIKIFTNENTYKNELKLFLDSFLSPQNKKIIIAEEESPNKEKTKVVDESIINNNETGTR